MGKVLLIGKKNPIFKDIYVYLEREGDFCIQVSPEQKEVVQYFVDIVELDVVVISLIGLDDSNNELFRYFKDKQPYIKALCFGNDFEQDVFKNWLASDYYDVIDRPFSNNEILDKIKTLIEISEREKEEREEQRRLRMMTGIDEWLFDEELPEDILPIEEDSLEERLNRLKTERNDKSRRKIMLIDDNVVQLRALRGNLMKDYDVLLASSGGEALKIMEKNVPDVVFLDYEMPGLDGKSVLKIMRDHSVLKDIPVVFLTGETDKERIIEVFKLSPDGYMLKPANLDKIRAKIIELLGE